MALQKAKFTDIPLDAVILNEEDALKYQLNTLNDWHVTKDTWIFRHSLTILSSMTALTSIYINNHYRTKFRLQSYGRFSSYLPVVVIPSLATAMFHQQLITTDILLQKSCPVCVQIRSASIQCLASTLFPTILAPLAALPFAIRYLTYKVPPITSEPRKVYNMMYRHTKPIGNILLGLLAVNGLVAALLTYQETKSFLNIQTKLIALEKEYELNTEVRN